MAEAEQCTVCSSIPCARFRYVIIEISVLVMFPLYRAEFMSQKIGTSHTVLRNIQ